MWPIFAANYHGFIVICQPLMTSWHRNGVRQNWPFSGRYPSQRTNNAELWDFLCSYPRKDVEKQRTGPWFDTPCRWGIITVMQTCFHSSLMKCVEKFDSTNDHYLSLFSKILMSAGRLWNHQPQYVEATKPQYCGPFVRETRLSSSNKRPVIGKAFYMS